MTWEYQHRYFSHPFPHDDLDELGKQGWELVAISQRDAHGNSFFYFKRPGSGLAATLGTGTHFEGEILPPSPISSPSSKQKKKKG